jgi:transcriptional regulator with XRE-family HTH domain
MTDQEKLAHIREALHYTQSAMAARLGMSLRQYSDLENAKSTFRPVYLLAAERVAMIDAISQKDITAAPAVVRNDALALADLIRGKPDDR